MQSKSLIDVLKEVVKEDLHLKLDEDNCIIIEENKQDAKCRQVVIKWKKSLPYFGFSLDIPKQAGKNDPIYPFLNPQYPGICRKNDAIVFLQKSNIIYVLLIEMKSDNTKGYLQQLKLAQGFIEFILQRLKILKKEINTQVEFRGILFSCRRIPNEGETTKKPKKQKIIFEDRNGLLVAEISGNTKYWIQQFLDNIDEI
ncbi:MAG: hypothetical protein EAZ87_00940 [Nostocales cyanobacterium]|nr:MAG: hypothetical protein EAZ87_00940 [Nostocales cyanobacterium]